MRSASSAIALRPKGAQTEETISNEGLQRVEPARLLALLQGASRKSICGTSHPSQQHNLRNVQGTDGSSDILDLSGRVATWAGTKALDQKREPPAGRHNVKRSSSVARMCPARRTQSFTGDT